MSKEIINFWNKKYQDGHSQRYVWDEIVSFYFNFCRQPHGYETLKVLEVGCGTGANLVFFAELGHRVSGVDGADEAIRKAAGLFKEKKLTAELLTGSFCELRFPDHKFDIVVDRGALTCVGKDDFKRAFFEVQRVLKPGGYFFFNPYADFHSEAPKKVNKNGLAEIQSDGRFLKKGFLNFFSEDDIRNIFDKDIWTIHSFKKKSLTELALGNNPVHGEWIVVVQKTGAVDVQ